MNLTRPLTWLRIALAAVMGWGALRLIHQAHGGALHGGIHPPLALALGILETAGSVLFLVPPTTRPGAWLLAASLALAALLHLHTGQAPPPVYLVYAAGVWTVAAETGSA